MKRFSLLLALAACSTTTDEPTDTDTTDTDPGDTQVLTREEEIAALDGDASAGATLYGVNCALCHAVDGSGGTGPALAGAPIDELDAYTVILNGVEGTSMSGFDGLLTDQEIADIWAHVETL